MCAGELPEKINQVVSEVSGIVVNAEADHEAGHISEICFSEKDGPRNEVSKNLSCRLMDDDGNLMESLLKS